MDTILGIDLGSNSVGWAIRNNSINDNQIIDYGVLTFEKGVASEKGNEFPKVKKRTESRGKRRNYQSEKYRKYSLLEFLILNNMCPLTIEELNNWRKYSKNKKREYPKSKIFLEWLRYDFDGDGQPDFHLFGKDKHESYYIFRNEVINAERKIIFQKNPQILGRVFYQLVQRRGFRGRDEEEAKTILKGSEKTGTAGRDEISEYIDKYKTLGSALFHYQKENGGRIRQRYNLRKDYEDELKEICRVHNINDSDFKKLRKAIIWQRPLRTQKGLIGTCIYERNKKRAPISHPLYEEYRTWIFINNLKIEPPIGVDKQNYIQEKIYPLFYKTSNDFELKSILTQLIKDGALMFSNFHSKTKVISAKLLKSFQEILGEDWKEKYDWENIHNRDNQPKKRTSGYYDFEDIWHILNTFDGKDDLKKFALEKLYLEEEKAKKFSEIKLNQGYATLSLSAIKKIIPFLRKGYLYSQAVYMANLYKVLGTNEVNEDLVNYFGTEIESLINSNNEQKSINNIVNNLIASEVNEEYRYSIEVERDLDNSEKNLILDKITDVFGEKTWNGFEESKKTKVLNYVSIQFKEFLKKSMLSKKNVFIQQPRLHDQIFKFLKDTYNVPNENKKYLWHPSEQENYSSALDYEHYYLKGKDVFISEKKIGLFLSKNPDAEYQGRSFKLLSDPEPISRGFKNPMALKTLHKLKRLINYLIQSGKIDENTRIVIEIARELNDSNKRKAIEKWNNEREKENKVFEEKIIEINKECNTTFDEKDKTLIKKIRLWEEQGRKCMYTGRSIATCDVFNGGKYDIEHTIPASLSFDSELKNLTLADTNYNRNIKGKLFPTQLPNYEKETLINGINYPPIIKTMEYVFGKRILKTELKKGKEVIHVSWEKIDALENLYDEWKKKTTYASTKEVKDACIQRSHIIKIDLEYWKSKLKSFIIEEYKAGWKNSQLRDTQIVTKYALPYLKTVFNKVTVEKAEVINAFKEIYNIKLPFDKKNRKVHSHHAIDAAILTLIPSSFERDKILLKYNEEKDRKTGKVYHEQPKNWNNFTPSCILSIEHQILINNLPDYKTTLPTYKKIRKRGKIEYIKFRDENGKWHYSLDENGKKISKIAQGDTIRGQLHGESLYGAIKQPKRDQNNKILFDDKKKMILHDETYVVIRKPLVYKKDANSLGFKSLDELEKVIVDKDLFKMIKLQVDLSDFKTAITNGVFMFDKNGHKVNKIRRIRCKESLKFNSAVKVHAHQFISKKEYKRHTLAINGENTLCLFYKDELSKAISIQSIGKIADSKIKKDRDYFNEPYYNKIELGKGNKKCKVALYAILRSGQKVIFYDKKNDELKDLINDESKEELSKRMFKIYQFESDGRIKFKHHLAAGIDTELKKENKEFSSFNINDSPVFLRLSQAQWNFAIEGKDFAISLDGEIKWKENN